MAPFRFMVIDEDGQRVGRFESDDLSWRAGDTFTLETVIAMFALGEHLHQLLVLEPGEMHARSGRTHFADDRQLSARARMAIEQAVEHARPRRLADGSRNAGHTNFNGRFGNHTWIVDELTASNNWHAGIAARRDVWEAMID